MKLFTIGFTRTSAERFFDRLRRAKIGSLVDVRLNNVSQLAGFAKRDDLRYFTRELVHVPYVHRPELAPTQELLDAFKKNAGGWDEYERAFLDLMAARRVHEALSRDQLDGACLLCSEAEPHHCHRRLVAEHLRRAWDDVDIVHL
ncbi:MAG: DUF488 domain-containing protein [Deltaproteobacteria bacterium]|nr:DUF488 domain-containing protein [Deltaproteobacteria bacterium]